MEKVLFKGLPRTQFRIYRLETILDRCRLYSSILIFFVNYILHLIAKLPVPCEVLPELEKLSVVTYINSPFTNS